MFSMSAAYEDPAARVRAHIARWLETTLLGQRAFVKDLDKSQVWLQKILAGKNAVRLKDLDVVAQAMRTTASELVRGHEERHHLELTPSEIRILEQLRRRPDVMDAVYTILRIPAPPKETPARDLAVPKPRAVGATRKGSKKDV